MTLNFTYGAAVGQPTCPPELEKHEARSLGLVEGQALVQAVGQAVGHPDPEGDAMVDVTSVVLEHFVTVPLALAPDDPDDADVVAALVAKGLRESPPFALLRSNWKVSYVLCWTMSWEVESEFRALPDLYAYMKFPDDLVKSMVPPFHELQLEPKSWVSSWSA